MMMLVSYDVAKDEKGEKRLRRVAKILENYGQRVQYSVFECLVDPGQWVELKKKLLNEIWERKIEHIGQKKPLNPQGILIL